MLKTVKYTIFLKCDKINLYISIQNVSVVECSMTIT